MGATMFMASDNKLCREYKVRFHLRSEPGISLLVAAVNFEWTVCRAVLFLSRTPNSKLRAKMRDYFSLEGYKELWKLEVAAPQACETLAGVVRNWSSVRKAFEARNRLVHGRDRFTRNMATPHVEALVVGAGYVDDYCRSLGYPLCDRMPVRRRYPRSNSALKPPVAVTGQDCP